MSGSGRVTYMYVRTVGIPTYVSDKMQLAGGKDGVWVWGWIYRTGKGYVYAYM